MNILKTSGKWSILGLQIIFAMASSASDVQNRSGGGICDVSAAFELITPTIKEHQPLKIRVRFQNQSTSPAAFRYFERSFVQHLVIYDEKSGTDIPFRLDAPFLEAAPTTLRLRPGEVFTKVIMINVWPFFDLDPGRYFFKLRYDLRLITDQSLAQEYKTRYHSNDFVAWDTKNYPFSVRK
jgi:hypothetical protein